MLGSSPMFTILFPSIICLSTNCHCMLLAITKSGTAKSEDTPEQFVKHGILPLPLVFAAPGCFGLDSHTPPPPWCFSAPQAPRSFRRCIRTCLAKSTYMAWNLETEWVPFVGGVPTRCTKKWSVEGDCPEIAGEVNTSISL